MMAYENFIYAYERKFPLNEVSNVYEASIFCQELGERRHRAMLLNRAMLLIKSIVANLMRRIFKFGK